MFNRNRFHPKNIYKVPPNFKELAIKFPEFRKYVRQELSGRSTIDYHDPKAVKELTRTLLKKDFNLDVEIDDKRLIPRVPLCLNYILWLEDLLEFVNPETQKNGIDIGTGNVCIYSLLAASRGWKMLATETDPENFSYAEINIRKNHLEKLVSLKMNSDSNKLLMGVLDDNVVYDFCMCNPPFYDYTEKPVNRTLRRVFLPTVASDIHSEVCTEGGEVFFVKKLLKESIELKNQVKIFTTLIGKKCDFLVLKKELQKACPKSVAYTEFCQGKTIRWGMAWTFHDISLKNTEHVSLNRQKKRKTNSPLSLTLPVHESYSEDKLSECIKNLFTMLDIKFKEEIINGSLTVTFEAHKNTWSHQRRKKRMIARKREELKDKNDLWEKEDDFEQCSNLKKSKLDCEIISSKKNNDSAVEGFITVKPSDADKSFYVFEMSWLSGKKESLHQIFQFIKNNLAREGPCLNETQIQT